LDNHLAPAGNDWISSAGGIGLDNGLACNPELETVFMRLVINGKEQTFDDSLNLAQLVEQLGMKGDRVAVELNREIVPRAQWTETTLNDGDRLEIVHFVGGG
jgi:thiamine biosynthesis protein ThiS